MRTARSYGLPLSAFRALPLTDRLLALGLQAYEDNRCPDCGQRLDLALDPDLAEDWTTMEPVRDHACTAIAVAAEANKDATHMGALRYPVGLRQDWEQRRSAARAERAASDEAGQD